MPSTPADRLTTLSVGLLLCAIPSGYAFGDTVGTTVTLADRNSEAVISPDSQGGMTDWMVDGLDHLVTQWFWFRVGNGAESSLDTLPIIGSTVTDTNPFADPRDDTYAALYQGTGFEIEVLFSLRGGLPGDGVSDITEAIIIRNTGASPLDFHFFQYSDFDMGGTASGDDVGQVFNGNSIAQSDLANGNVMTETVTTPMPDHFEMSDVSAGLLASLNDGGPTTLSDAAGPVQGDLNWGFQWDFTLGVDGSFMIAKDKNITPAPGPLALLCLAAFAVTRRRRA